MATIATVTDIEICKKRRTFYEWCFDIIMKKIEIYLKELYVAQDN